MYRQIVSSWALAILLSGFAILSTAATFTVEQDGSGDYTIIQDALDSAAAGDTIQIGAGQFTDFTSVSEPGGLWPLSIYMNVSKQDLTIIGSGPETTIIGPTTPGAGDESHVGLMSLEDPAAILRIEDLAVTNCETGVSMRSGGLIARRFAAMENQVGINWKASGQSGVIEDCHFANCSTGLLIEGDASGTLITDCVFDAAQASLQNAGSLLLERCEFTTGWCRLLLLGNTSANIRGCEFHDLYNNAVMLNDEECTAEIYDCRLAADDKVIYSLGGRVTCTHSVISGGQISALVYLTDIPPANAATVNTCNLEPAGVYAARVSQDDDGDAATHDFSGNWWGTTDAAAVDALIFDRNDLAINNALISYQPLASGSVSTKKTTWSNVRSMFR